MKSIRTLLGTLLVLVLSLITIKTAQAVHADSIYIYDFRNATGTIANQAAANAGVNLTLVGAWSSSANGTTFTGNTTTSQSTSYAKPSSGPTISATASQAVGAAVIFTQDGTCGTDSENITQIGKFAANAGQVKLQLSKCNGGRLYPECRIAGALTSSSVLALRGSVVIARNNPYRLECVKSPDQGSSTQVVMRTTDLTTNVTTTNTFNIAATGTVSSTLYLSAGGKYPSASQSNNTDQYTGMITMLGYCVSADVSTTQACLNDVRIEATEPPVDPPVDPPATGGSVDEVKYSYGDTRDQVVFSWRGSESAFSYGLDDTYGNQATAVASSISPVDIAGPFMQVKISGLEAGTSYHYRIGADGQDHTFTTAVTDEQSFKAVAIGDTIASSCRTYQSAMYDLVAAQSAQLVLHHGDIAIANECGVPAVHQFYTDIQNSFSLTTAFMPVWGNHEYGNPTANAPAGTPTDTLANYKGRSVLPNAQTVPNDTATTTSDPGCGRAMGSSTNTCLGNDWGWFRSGRVLFISFPEPWYNAIGDWKTKADVLMAQAQADPSVDYVVTYGHRPILSSTSYTPPSGWSAAFSQLADSYSPSASNPAGKYVLDLTGHRHDMEVFENYHGLMQVVNGGGGQGFLKFSSIVSGSSFRMKHLGFSTLSYDADTHQLTFNMICGPSATGQDVNCTPGSTVYSRVFSRP